MRRPDVFSLLKPYGRDVGLILACLLAINLSALIFPWSIKIIIDRALSGTDFLLLGKLIAVLVGTLVLRSLFCFLRAFLGSALGEKITRDLKQRLHRHLLRVPLATIYKMSPGQILGRMTGDVESMKRFFSGDALEFVYAVLNVGLILTALLFLNAKLIAVSLLPIPLLALVYAHFISELHERHRRMKELNGNINARIGEVLAGIKVIRCFAGNAHEEKTFEQGQRNFLETALGAHYFNSWMWSGIEFFTSVSLVSVLWQGGSEVAAGRMSIGELVAFYTYLGMLFSPIIRLVIIQSSYQEATASMKRINEFLTSEENCLPGPSLIRLSRIVGRIEFRNVSFGYAEGQSAVKEIDFMVRPGETVAVVGPSGSGKTTLMTLLLGLFEPQAGEIRLDGYDLRFLDPDGYRERIGVVVQDDVLFQGTIEDNIRYGRLKSSMSEIVAAACIAQAHEFIENLPQGYRTQVGERGVNLSSGQRQRIAIARAIIRNPAILVLDEATSAVDALTENKIQSAIRTHMQGRTTFIVAHRFSSIMEADRIIVLERGRITESGGHNHLLKKRGLYSNLYFEQFKEKDTLQLSASHG